MVKASGASACRMIRSKQGAGAAGRSECPHEKLDSNVFRPAPEASYQLASVERRTHTLSAADMRRCDFPILTTRALRNQHRGTRSRDLSWSGMTALSWSKPQVAAKAESSGGSTSPANTCCFTRGVSCGEKASRRLCDLHRVQSEGGCLRSRMSRSKFARCA